MYHIHWKQTTSMHSKLSTTGRWKKAKAIPIMPCIEDEIEQPNITTTDPEIADLKQMPFSAGGKLFFSGDGKTILPAPTLWSVAIC